MLDNTKSCDIASEINYYGLNALIEFKKGNVTDCVVFAEVSQTSESQLVVCIQFPSFGTNNVPLVLRLFLVGRGLPSLST